MKWWYRLTAPWREHAQLWVYVLIQTEHITALSERVAELESKSR